MGMAQWAKCLLHKHGHPRSAPQHPLKKLSVAASACNPSPGKSGAGRIWGLQGRGPLASGLCKMISFQFSLGDAASNKVQSVRIRYLASASGLHVYTCEHIHVCMYAHACARTCTPPELIFSPVLSLVCLCFWKSRWKIGAGRLSKI